MENLHHFWLLTSQKFILYQLACWGLHYLVVNFVLFLFHTLIWFHIFFSVFHIYSSDLLCDAYALFERLVFKVFRIILDDRIVDARLFFDKFVYLLLVLLTFFCKMTFLRLVRFFHNPIIQLFWILSEYIHILQLEVVSSVYFVSFLAFCSYLWVVWGFSDIKVVEVICFYNFLLFWFWTELNGAFSLRWYAGLRNVVEYFEVIENVIFTLDCFWIELLNLRVDEIFLLDVKNGLSTIFIANRFFFESFCALVISEISLALKYYFPYVKTKTN